MQKYKLNGLSLVKQKKPKKAPDPLQHCGKDMVKSFLLRTGLIFGFIFAGALAFKSIDFKANMSFLHVAILSGSTVGNYYATINRLIGEAGEEKGSIINISSRGSVDNIKRLSVAQTMCTVHFALVQDGTDWDLKKDLQLVGRVGKPESVLFLGSEANKITQFSDLKGVRIGIGPEGSGTALLARQILSSPSFKDLQLTLVTMGISEQMEKLVNKELALGVFVMQEDATLLHTAINKKGLQIANFQNMESLAHLFPYLYTSSIVSGQYNPVLKRPPSKRAVLKLDTLLISNRCVSHSETIAIMTLLRKQFPDFIARNRQAQIRHAMTMAPSARYFIDNNGGSLADTHVPWLVDFMPTSNWVYAVMILSLFYNFIVSWNNFRLASIDANRVAAERSIDDLFGKFLLKDEIARYNPSEEQDFSEERLDELIVFLEKQMDHCRQQSQSVLVPMGEEIGYRDQEVLIETTLSALKILRYRIDLGHQSIISENIKKMEQSAAKSREC